MASVMAPMVMGRQEEPFFGILRRGYAYRTPLYLALAPVVSYFCALLVIVIFGLQDGSLVGLAPVFILACAYPASVIERGLAHALLGVSFTPIAKPLPDGATVWDRFKVHLLNLVTWKSLLFLASRVLFGIFALFLMSVMIVSR